MREDYQISVNRNFDVQNAQGVEINAIEKKRLDSNYTNKDLGWETNNYNGNIYISTPDITHNEILKHYENPEHKISEKGFPGTSGFFTNEETASQHFIGDETFDSVGLGHNLQQAPFYDEKKEILCERAGVDYNPEYNGHLDCFRINEQKMLENYGTTDFYAAQAKCMENYAWGDGGGFQGYNPYINEMINNGSLEYVPEKSRICNENACVDYADRKDVAQKEAQEVNDYIKEKQISGKEGEKLGYNELPCEENISYNPPDPPISSKKVDARSELGGGSHAPPTQNGEKPEPKNKKDQSQNAEKSLNENGEKPDPSSNKNASKNPDAQQNNGEKPHPEAQKSNGEKAKGVDPEVSKSKELEPASSSKTAANAPAETVPAHSPALAPKNTMGM